MMGDRKKMETIFSPMINYYRNQREIKKADAQNQTPKNKDKLC
jgi:hypothetical protein